MMATMRNKPGVVQLKGGDLRHFKGKIRDDQRLETRDDVWFSGLPDLRASITPRPPSCSPPCSRTFYIFDNRKACTNQANNKQKCRTTGYTSIKTHVKSGGSGRTCSRKSIERIDRRPPKKTKGHLYFSVTAASFRERRVQQTCHGSNSSIFNT